MHTYATCLITRRSCRRLSYEVTYLAVHPPSNDSAVRKMADIALLGTAVRCTDSFFALHLHLKRVECTYNYMPSLWGKLILLRCDSTWSSNRWLGMDRWLANNMKNYIKYLLLKINCYPLVSNMMDLCSAVHRYDNVEM